MRKKEFIKKFESNPKFRRVVTMTTNLLKDGVLVVVDGKLKWSGKTAFNLWQSQGVSILLLEELLNKSFERVVNEA